ncbi:cell envelope integrity protein TolA [Vibrio cholerae]
MKEKKSLFREYKKPILISVGLHAALVVALIWGTDFTMSTPKPTGQLVQAVVIDPSAVRAQAQQIRSQREEAAKKEQERLDKLRRESEKLEQNRKAEEERIRKLKEQQAQEAKAAREAEKRRVEKEKQREAEEQRVAKLEAERKAKEEAVKKAEQERLAKEAAIAKAEQERVAREKAAQEAQEKARREREAAEKAEQERIAKQEAAKKAEQERIEKERAAKEAAEKARQEQERLQRLERERKEQEAALNDIFAGLESESQSNSSARSRHVASEADRYGAIYTQLIQQNLLLEDSFRGKSCLVNLRLIPTGSGAIVGNLSVREGDSRLCAATKSAVAKVGTFPLPTDQDIVNKLKDINLRVIPE